MQNFVSEEISGNSVEYINNPRVDLFHFFISCKFPGTKKMSSLPRS